MTDKDTMRLWNAVSKTDPSNTKEVNFGRKFTAIDAHSQIMEATRQFGPVGVGWGYNVTGVHSLGDDLVVCLVELWHGQRGNVIGPMPGCSEKTVTRKGAKVPDPDCTKKAVTDALTKMLSHLGFNADVFLGKFDDNKYVNERRNEVADSVNQGLRDAWTSNVLDALPEGATDAQKAEALANALAEGFRKAKKPETMDKKWDQQQSNINFIREHNGEALNSLIDAFENHKMRIKGEYSTEVAQ